MADDRKSDQQSAEHKALIEQLDSTMTLLWNATVEMDTVAQDCKVKPGESLFDRINKCEASFGAWEKALADLKLFLAELKKRQAVYAAKRNDEASRLAETTYDIALRQHGEMSASLKRVRESFAKHKQKIRKVKA